MNKQNNGGEPIFANMQELQDYYRFRLEVMLETQKCELLDFKLAYPAIECQFDGSLDALRTRHSKELTDIALEEDRAKRHLWGQTR